VEDLKKHASELGLDSQAFNACVDNRTYKKDVDTDITDGQKVGVYGTPAFFVNGRALWGDQPMDAFKRVIDEELQKK